jgi:hypothetical protein
MIENRIGELRLRIRTALPDSGDLKARAEWITRLTLERCSEVLDRRAPDRIMLIRRLPLRWRMDDVTLDDADTLEQLAQSVAETIERTALPVQLERYPPDADVIFFHDEAHLRAAQLLASARPRQAWFQTILDEAGDPLTAMAAPGARPVAHAALIRLAAAGMLGAALAAQPQAAVAVLSAALGFAPILPTSVPVAGRREAQADAARAAIPDRAMVAELRATMARWPPVTRAAQWIGLHIHAALLADAEPDAPPSIAVALAASVPVTDADIMIEPPRPSPAASSAPPAERRRLGFWDDPTTPGDSPPPLPPEPEDAPEIAALTLTRCAGLFYLLDRIQELDLAESLWKACLPEGAVLAAAAAALLGPAFAGDPAITLFGGIDEIGSAPDLTAEQHAEIATATCAALAIALPRRGLADIPPIVASIRAHHTGRLLVAAAEGSPFAFFAWPANSGASLIAGLDALLAAWPHAATITAKQAIASLDTNGRLRTSTDLAEAPLLLPDAPSIPAAALLTLVAGAPCTLFAARAGSLRRSLPAFVASHLARSGRIRFGHRAMEVVMAIDDIDLAARRAGLDRDPGRLPWLDREVRFVFEESNPASSADRT